MEIVKLTMISFLFATEITLIKADNPCEGRHLEFVNDYSDCTRYFSCLFEFPHRKQCPDDRWFSSDPTPVCRPAGSFECDLCPATGIVSVGVTQTCSSYRLCINGASMDRECAPGTLFDVTEGRCNLAENVDCDYQRCPAEGVLIIPDPIDCQHYLVCDNGQKFRRRCLDGLLFDPILNSCAIADEVDCINLT